MDKAIILFFLICFSCNKKDKTCSDISVPQEIAGTWKCNYSVRSELTPNQMMTKDTTYHDDFKITFCNNGEFQIRENGIIIDSKRFCSVDDSQGYDFREEDNEKYYFGIYGSNNDLMRTNKLPIETPSNITTIGILNFYTRVN